ncbi:bifunctional [glutamine synthetase] adenylyltransferase/[glutamine synthetase]-adenylyl-L-tyrosine phosphorylase [Rathayibacter soli]|uniref:bifunctional [glutamine synthetase] adenylyltransferase/[glutamine synthetase]-adenylyl-L-tyrosine phosphorylase n=1 Tax=Rathayibacter soli TaxID=3144168 RepID=UPI0027E49E6E|nr:bifunctional [glutamine synthetase] adenylyltransferase/[glutamine synthetase]-adenylyl-L-tyrosine phosphorylase [Glaciibacter superstes]
MVRDALPLTTLARAGFVQLSEARARLDELQGVSSVTIDDTLPLLSRCADPDAALSRLLQLLRQAPERVRPLMGDSGVAGRLLRVLGASSGLCEFFLRRPDQLDVFEAPVTQLPSAQAMRAALADDSAAELSEEGAWSELRTRYRRTLAQVASFDLEQGDPIAGIDAVAAALADLAGAALDESLSIARRAAVGTGPGRFPADEVAATMLAIIGMGKSGARELNYLSDVDVIFVTEPNEPAGLSSTRAVDIATRLAVLTIRGIDAPAREPELWEVDVNLRPEGKDGALVRTLDSHLAYYQRWAKSWEFQALLKASPLAGDRALGRAYVDALAPQVWASALRENFVESVQAMRERVTDNIPDDEVERQLKLGPGGLRDIEFTVQLLQLVHGVDDAAIRVAGTLPALAALAAQGYIGRPEAAEFAQDYRVLRLLEHRLQLSALRRTHLMPRDENELRVLARATTLAAGAEELIERWSGVKRRVRGLHERLFYRPLLAAVAALPTDERALSSDQAIARLAAIGFRDPRGALAHIAALTSGVSRRASIQRHLLPVMLQWFADGADPDYGLLTFRRLSEGLGSTHWFLRMLRDSSGAAERLTRVLSGSKFVGELVGRIPEAVAWLDSEDELRPRPREVLREEMLAVLARHKNPDTAAIALRGARRREVLRLAFASVLGLSTVRELAEGLSDITETLLEGVLGAIRLADDGVEFAIIGMGRFGGREVGFGSDADVMYVFRDVGGQPDRAHTRALKIVSELNRLTEDDALPLDLDIGLRPEGKNGTPVRSLMSYRAYYQRWSLTWEAQALLRARGITGDANLLADFELLADEIRYPSSVADQSVREIKRIKARVENERLPQGADPARHLKLGRGSLSDVEWFVQLIQLRHAAAIRPLRTPSTLDALDAAVDAGLVGAGDAQLLRDAWLFASRARSAMTLWTNKTSDLLPVDRLQLNGVARLLAYPPGSATQLEEDYLAVTRRSRAVFERTFYGPDQSADPTTA